MNAVARWVLDTGYFICVRTLRLPDVVNQISPHTSEGISGWLTCHNPSFSELGQVMKHVDMFCIEVVGLDNHLHQFTSIAHFCTVSRWKGIYLYFYLVEIQIFDYRIITTSWSCLNTLSATWRSKIIRILYLQHSLTSEGELFKVNALEKQNRLELRSQCLH